MGILFCLGLVQVIGYMCQWMLRPKVDALVLHHDPVSGHMEDAEQVLRWAFSTMRWDYWANANWLLILDMGRMRKPWRFAGRSALQESGARILTPQQLLELMGGNRGLAKPSRVYYTRERANGIKGKSGMAESKITTIEGSVEEVVFHSEDTGFTRVGAGHR